MLKTMVLATTLGVWLSGPAFCQEYTTYPAPTPGYPFQRSFLTGRAIVIPPYDRLFPVRVYTTPPMPPYYNVPPYAVAAPY